MNGAKEVHVVDCGANNLASVCNALRVAGAVPTVVRTPDEVRQADRIVLPGVGSAAHAVDHLTSTGMAAALTDRVRRQAQPLLAICVGMQVLAERVHEHGERHGLGWIAGEVKPLRDVVPKRFRIPHMGWSSVTPVSPLADSLGRFRGAPTYFFCHSYALSTPRRDAVVATVDLDTEVVAALRFETVLGTQFHPERSHMNGVRLIESFLSWSP